MSTRNIETTEDGSSTLFVPELDEHYHSVHGAIQESTHVFIEAGLKHQTHAEVVIFEVGFGTGLNALLTYLAAQSLGKLVKYITIEKYPLTTEESAALNYSEQLGVENLIFEQLHSAKWNEWTKLTPNFEMFKIHGDLLENTFSNLPRFNLIYFDAFAPNKQPKLWTQEIYQKIYDQCLPETVLTTYCAKGVVRREMQAVGFKMERIPGPPGKKEMLRGIK